MYAKTLFEKIIDKEVPAKIEYEDKLCLAIHDINPKAPVHILIIPKKAIVRLSAVKVNDKKILGHLLLIASTMAKKLKCESGFRVVINNGSQANEEIPHLHLHVIGGRQMNWPPG